MKCRATIFIAWDDDTPGLDISMQTFPSIDKGKIPNNNASKAAAMMIKAVFDSGAPIRTPKQKILQDLMN